LHVGPGCRQLIDHRPDGQLGSTAIDRADRQADALERAAGGGGILSLQRRDPHRRRRRDRHLEGHRRPAGHFEAGLHRLRHDHAAGLVEVSGLDRTELQVRSGQ
jgi:hypothetical protein